MVLPIELIARIREQFGPIPDADSKDPIGVYMMMKKLEQVKPHKGPGEGGKTKVPVEGAQGENPEVELVRPSKQVGTGAKVIFDANEARLSPESIRSLDAIAALIKGHRNVFLVKGHASSDDFAEGTEESMKMQLSLKRAQVAADFLISKGVERETLRVQGCSTFEPVVQRAYTEENKAQNRRVEVLATGTLVKELQGSGKTDFLKTDAAAEPAKDGHH
jgi:outer membrane protein OmpA-like peptidoglycan-associated protein